MAKSVFYFCNAGNFKLFSVAMRLSEVNVGIEKKKES